MRISVSRRPRTIVALGVVVIVAAAIVGYGMARSSDPAYQQRISMPGMSGVEDYLVNLWTEPHPPAVGPRRLIAQVTSSIGTPTQLTGLTFTLSSPDGQTSGPIDATPLAAGDSPENGWAAPVDFNAPGAWRITVRIRAGDGIERETTFTVDVAD